jgi:hypothetical protein
MGALPLQQNGSKCGSWERYETKGLEACNQYVPLALPIVLGGKLGE